MEKYDSLDMELLCVNPYDVMGTTITADIPLQEETSVAKQNWEMLNGGETCILPKKIKLEMEEFSDLSAFVAATDKSFINSVDELNTPVFIKEAFNFTTAATQITNTNSQGIVNPTNSNIEGGLFKLEYNIYENSAIVSHLNDINTVNSDENNLLTSELSPNNNLENTEVKVQHTYEDTTETPMSSPLEMDETYMSIYNNMLEGSGALSVTGQYSNITSPNLGVVTPDDSNCSTISSNPETPRRKPHHLKLNFNFKSTTPVLNTPDVLDSVVNLEASGGFNILDIDDNEEITTVNAEDLLSILPSTSSIFLPLTSPPPAPAKRQAIRKRKSYDDDDEDYIPPKKLRTPQQNHRSLGDDDDSDDSDFEEKVKPRPRGRPPKRSTSISSDCGSKDGDAYKYRELRDKNNEASRKSRLKRKIKEIGLEQEQDVLTQKNVKLKAQVEELEKMVTNFRNNLFKILIKK